MKIAFGEPLFKLKGSENKIYQNMNKVMVKCSFGSDHLLAINWFQIFCILWKKNSKILRTSPFGLEFVDNISKNDLWFRIWIIVFMSSVPVVANAKYHAFMFFRLASFPPISEDFAFMIYRAA